MKLEFTQNVFKCFQAIKCSAPEVADRIKSVLKDALQHTETGLGDPTALEGKFKGLWQRKISFNEFITYAFDEEKLVVTSIKVNIKCTEDTAANDIKLGEFSEDEYASVMGLMAANRGKDSEPKVGIF